MAIISPSNAGATTTSSSRRLDILERTSYLGGEPVHKIMTDTATDSVIDALTTGRDWIRWGASELHRAHRCSGHGFSTPLDECAFLIRHLLGLPQTSDDHWLDAHVLRAERQMIYDALHERIVDARPTAYITGEAWFAGLPFAVDERVLIPRSPLGELIQAQFRPWLPDAPRRILDLCCGSGCIGIAAALAFPDAELVLADLSPDALSVAADNVELYGLEARCSLVESDLFAALDAEPFDLILTNPPYVPREEVEVLPAEFGHEPRMGLESGDDGLFHPAQIVAQARQFLTERGALIGEVGAWWPELEAAFPRVSFTWVELEQGGEGVFFVPAEGLPKG